MLSGKPAEKSEQQKKKREKSRKIERIREKNRYILKKYQKAIDNRCKSLYNNNCCAEVQFGKSIFKK
ncbi:MAG TPA: hypothetical protein DDX91_00390 [Ruminococcaceae bacterium]|nr:hypothetical protein [Oscillospiraceae bacterium]